MAASESRGNAPRNEEIIRDCSVDDLPAVQRIYGHYVLTSVATFEEEPPGFDYWRGRLDEIRALGLPFLVAEIDGHVVGYSFCSRWRPRPAYRFTVEDSIYLSPDALGMGIGSRLLRAVIDACAQLGVREVIAVIATRDDEASAALHRRLGFREVGRLSAVGLKFDRWIDTILMQLSLRDAAQGTAPDKALGAGRGAAQNADQSRTA